MVPSLFDIDTTGNNARVHQPRTGLTRRSAQETTHSVKRHSQEHFMPKGQQLGNKMVKKPKKDSGVPKESGGVSDRPTPPTTAVLPKGKLKNK